MTNSTSISLSTAPIDSERLLQQVGDRRAGAVVLFLGVTRQFTGDLETKSLTYSSYEGMAQREMQRLADHAQEQWNLMHIAMQHRVGEVPVGETSVAIAVSSAHREAAFEAGKWLIDSLKECVPIWKEEFRPDGSREWVDPTRENVSSQLKPSQSEQIVQRDGG